MLAHLPHPTLHPTYPSPTGGITENESQTRLPPPNATRPLDSHHRSNTTIDFASIIPSSRSSSPSRSSVLLPFLQFGKDRSTSPEPVSPEEAAEFEHTYTGEKSPRGKGDTRSGKLANWFGGSSEPVNITLIPSPVKEKHDPFFDFAEMERGSARSSLSPENDSMTKRPQSRLQKSSSTLSVAKKNQAGSSKFTFWKSKPATNSEKSTLEEDELTRLDVQTALFQSGMTVEPSIEGFKSLQANAESVICRFQSAYRKSLQSVREVTSEKNVLRDELEAAQTRSEHLKLQLANMAAEAAKQKSAMQSMTEEVVALKCKLREDAEFRSRSLRIITMDQSDANESESLPDGYQKEKRQSGGSFVSHKSSSDSVFSQAPLGTCTPISAADTSPELYQAPRFDSLQGDHLKECQICHGVQLSEAWDVVHLLKEESRALKARIAQCESANEDALSLLDIVSTVR
ncbi:hypothetical protein EPUS_06774 [Endocarpon pusillum Z07020]|uniref:Uncharacterized protein n=1 Tax=Endocarpon pusillum (strain Z07020 / HMAS-L-300199) TaxID=1263415 RepID=U1G8P6_ENDPU|nr:uncharacterized protein EPUS_06774 [Endocarpon pusillum Z07020]ERF68358.1 hypothetical protein EPUS_06774 [Endocarpon pusillum Z07020]